VVVGLIGRGSMVGLQVAAGMQDFTHGLGMLTPGDAFRLEVGALQDVLPSLRNYVECSCVVSQSVL
jgi:hypothetical protein